MKAVGGHWGCDGSLERITERAVVTWDWSVWVCVLISCGMFHCALIIAYVQAIFYRRPHARVGRCKSWKGSAQSFQEPDPMIMDMLPEAKTGV